MDVAAWLQDLGLERYASAFRDNGIDAEVPLKLTVEDLISIGVTSLASGASCSTRSASFSCACGYPKGRHYSISWRELLTRVVRMTDIFLTGIRTHKDLQSSTKEDKP